MVKYSTSVVVVAAVAATCALAAPYESSTYHALVRRLSEAEKAAARAARKTEGQELRVLGHAEKATETDEAKARNARKGALANEAQALINGNTAAAAADAGKARTEGKEVRKDKATLGKEKKAAKGVVNTANAAVQAAHKKREFDEYLEARDFDDDSYLEARDFDELEERGFDDYELDMME